MLTRRTLYLRKLQQGRPHWLNRVVKVSQRRACLRQLSIASIVTTSLLPFVRDLKATTTGLSGTTSRFINLLNYCPQDVSFRGPKAGRCAAESWLPTLHMVCACVLHTSTCIGVLVFFLRKVFNVRVAIGVVIDITQKPWDVDQGSN